MRTHKDILEQELVSTNRRLQYEVDAYLRYSDEGTKMGDSMAALYLADMKRSNAKIKELNLTIRNL